MNVQNEGLHLSRRTLYRKWNTYIMEGEAALADGRGKHGNHNYKMTKEIFSAEVLKAEKSLYHIAKSILKMMRTVRTPCRMPSFGISEAAHSETGCVFSGHGSPGS